jgi:hypothetical protein
MISIFDRVANDNIGEIDWKAYIPFVILIILNKKYNNNL